MFDQFEKQPKELTWNGPKAMAAAAMGMLLSFGLCGVGFLGAADSPGVSLGIFSVIGAVIFCLSAFLMLAGFVILVVELIVAATRG